MTNWDTVSPAEVTAEQLAAARDEDFPDTYSGQAWRAARRLYLEEYTPDPEGFLRIDGWSPHPCLKGLDLTGFMVGWACNAVRTILGAAPCRDGATLVMGAGEEDQPQGVPDGPAEASLRHVLGG